MRSLSNKINTESRFYWFASYPKSGNTWLRIFIANLLSSDTMPVDINQLEIGPIASSKVWLGNALDFDINELTHEELDQIRPNCYRWLSDNSSEDEYLKVHDAYTNVSPGNPLIPPECVKGVVYIVRNPLDVAVSLSYHLNYSIDKAIKDMADKNYCLCGGKENFSMQLRQKLLTWSEHILSWINAKRLNTLVIRYEDMKERPLETFTKVADFLGLRHEEHTIASALEHCDIKQLQKQEKENNFNERHFNSKQFFRKGKVGDWRNHLSREQVAAIVQAHGAVMEQFGYLEGAQNLEHKSLKTPEFA